MAAGLAGRPLPTGTVLFRQGEAGDVMYVVARGHVRITLVEEGHVRHISVLGPGDFFGELSLLSGAPRTATAEVVEEATLLAISRDAFAILMQDDLDVVFRMMGVLGTRLGSADERLRQEIQRFERVRILVHCVRRCLDGDAATVTFDIEDFAATVTAIPSRVRALAEHLAANGIGAVGDTQWIVERSQVGRLLDALAGLVAR